LQISANERVSIGAAPMPCTTRPPISISGLAAVAETTEPAAKKTMPARNARLRPNMSPSRPAVMTRIAIVNR
jgi:hypothetical protein